MVKCISTDGKILVVVGNLKYSAHRQRLQGFFDRMTEYGRPQENFITAESFNEYSRTLRIVEENLKTAPIRGIYMVNESVAACAEAVKNFSPNLKPIIICHDLPRSTKALLKSGEVDFALEQDIYSQGLKSLRLMKSILIDADHVSHQEFTQINIINSENVEFWKNFLVNSWQLSD